MKNRQLQLAREVALVVGMVLLCCALGGWDWRLAVGFLGVVISGAALWGLFRGK